MIEERINVPDHIIRLLPSTLEIGPRTKEHHPREFGLTDGPYHGKKLEVYGVEYDVTKIGGFVGHVWHTVMIVKRISGGKIELEIDTINPNKKAIYWGYDSSEAYFQGYRSSHQRNRLIQ